MQRSNERAIEPPAMQLNGLKKDYQDNLTNIIEPQVCQEIFQSARQYMNHGIHAFPVGKNKAPLVERWNDRHFDLPDFENAEGIGSCPGLWPEPVIVFDLDGPMGRKSWDILIDKYGHLPPTYSVSTGRIDGGQHFYFKVPTGDLYIKSTSSKIAHKVDIRGTRGQAVLPPTVHKSGRQYQWKYDGQIAAFVDTSKIPTLPDRWVQALIETDCAYHPKERKAQKERQSTSRSSAYGLKALEEETERVRSAPEGQRNDTLNRAAFSLGQLVAGGELSQSLAENALVDAALATGLDEREVSKTLKSGLEKGMQEPRAPEPTYSNDAKDDKKPKSLGQSELLLELCKDLKFFHDADGTVFSLLPNLDFVLIGGKPFKDYLCRRFYLNHGKAPSREPLTAVLGVLRGQGCYDSPEVIPNIRLASHRGFIYLDLCNVSREVVKVSADGWEVVRNYPVFFRRPKGMLSLPTPKPGGSITDLKRHLNVKDNNSWRLIVSWMVQAMNPEGPYPLLVINGEQGTAKSTLSKLLRSIIDPNLAPLRSLPRSERDLAIACSNSWVQVLENISYIPDWLSDALCRLATGGGFSTRTLYENDEETLFASKRPIILNGICNFVTRHDLADRALMVNLEPIPDEKRVTEKELSNKFARSAPYIMGAFLDAVSMAIRNIESTSLDRLPRMADFALWVTAAEPALPWKSGDFIKTYDEKRAQTVRDSVESQPVGAAILKLMDDRDTWEGTPGELLAELESLTDERTKKMRQWPSNARWLSSRVIEVSSFLRKIGIEVTKERSDKRHIQIVKNSDGSDGSVFDKQKQVVTSDAKADAKKCTEKSDGHSVTAKKQKNQPLNATDANDAKKHTLCVWEEGII